MIKEKFAQIDQIVLKSQYTNQTIKSHHVLVNILGTENHIERSFVLELNIFFNEYLYYKKHYKFYSRFFLLGPTRICFPQTLSRSDPKIIKTDSGRESTVQPGPIWEVSTIF